MLDRIIPTITQTQILSFLTIREHATILCISKPVSNIMTHDHVIRQVKRRSHTYDDPDEPVAKRLKQTLRYVGNEIPNKLTVIDYTGKDMECLMQMYTTRDRSGKIYKQGDQVVLINPFAKQYHLCVVQVISRSAEMCQITAALNVGGFLGSIYLVQFSEADLIALKQPTDVRIFTACGVNMFPLESLEIN